MMVFDEVHVLASTVVTVYVVVRVGLACTVEPVLVLSEAEGDQV
jgi:hypothetical protein